MQIENHAGIVFYLSRRSGSFSFSVRDRFFQLSRLEPVYLYFRGSFKIIAIESVHLTFRNGIGSFNFSYRNRSFKLSYRNLFI